MDIKLAEESELPTVVKLFKEIVEKLSYYNEKAIANEINKYTQQELLAKIKEDPFSLIVAKNDAQVVGFCLSRMDDSLVWLEWFGVSERARNQGIAKKLVSYLEENLKKREAHKIWCDCRTSNIKSANLLSSCGYLPICTLKNHWYGQDFILWQKEFPN